MKKVIRLDGGRTCLGMTFTPADGGTMTLGGFIRDIEVATQIMDEYFGVTEPECRKTAMNKFKFVAKVGTSVAVVRGIEKLQDHGIVVDSVTSMGRIFA